MPYPALIAPVDSSQIECRVLHYLAGGPDEPIIQKFREGADPYVGLASKFYKEEIYRPEEGDPRFDEMEAKRGMGKQGRLMCLGYATKVLTKRGFIPIIQVLSNDLLWDGIEWVTHRGLVYQGVQNVVEIKGVQMTSDHHVLCGISNWQPAAALLQDENILFRALESGSANLPFLAMSLGRREEFSTSLFNARAGRQNILYFLTTSIAEKVHAAMRVLKKQLGIGLKNITDMLTFAPIKNIERGCLDESAQYLRDVSRQITTPIIATGGEGSQYIRRGANNVANFWHISSPFLAGTFQNWNWIEKIMIAGMFQAIYTLLLGKKTAAINELSPSLKKQLPTYDLSFAGPRNRFTILSEKGPLVVHNCGYGASGKAFKRTAKNGLYGPPVEISIEDSNDFVSLYRTDNPSICYKARGEQQNGAGYWQQCDRMISRLAGGTPVDWGPLHVRDHRIFLPNGAFMLYDTLEFHRPEPGEKIKDWEVDGYWRMRTQQGWKKMWGSRLTQHICEAVSRVIISQAMIRIVRMGYRVLNWPYDELLLLIPKDGKEQWHLDRCKAEMVREVPWLPGLPLDVEGTFGERYSK